MPSPVKVEWLSEEKLRSQADSFLNRYHPSRSIPIPIEEIIDLGLKLDIVPTPGLKQGFEVDAFISRDMTTIYVDEYTYLNVSTRYRFSLAHEVAHAVLHQKVFHSLNFNSIAEWKAVQAAIPERDYGALEWQAYAFAGHVLVPSAELHQRFTEARAFAEKQGVHVQSWSDEARRMVAGFLARQFEVSTAVVEKRLEKEGLWSRSS